MTDPSFPKTRDPYTWPFTSESIWNMPIHREAQYKPAGIQGTGFLYADDDVIIMTPGEPLTQVYTNMKDWTTQVAGARCAAEGQLLAMLPIPVGFVVPHEQGTPNMSAAVLKKDGRTVHQSQPFHRCEAGSYATSHYLYPEVDLFTGDGIEGAHGGSGLSSLGGTIRLEELIPGGVIRHALKIGIYAHRYLSYQGDTPGYRWPAVKADGYAGDCKGDPEGCYAGKDSEMEMGALLALPADFDLDSLQTEPGRILAKAFQDYGGYVSDDTHWQATVIMTEWSPAGRVREEFQKTWGMSFEGGGPGNPWQQDVVLIFKNLSVVVNNSADSIGGGPNADNRRRAPFAPPLTPPATPTPPDVLKIMPLGDSLTEGDFPDGAHSWRGYLRTALLAENVQPFDFVGDRYLQSHGDVEPYDKEHAGHGGYTIGPDTYRWCETCETSGVFEHVEGWLNVSEPDIILVLLGINDLFLPENHPAGYAESAPDRYEALIQLIQELRPKVKIVMSSLLQVGWTEGSDWPEYQSLNERIRAVGEAEQGDNLFFIDLNAIELSEEDFTDGLHLTASGAQKIADGWLAALLPFLR